MSVVLLPAVYFCKALQLRGPRHGPRTPPVADNRSCRLFCFLRFTSVRLFSCGGLDMAPALPRGGQPFMSVVLLPAVYFCKALQLRGPRHGPRTPPVADRSAGAVWSRGQRPTRLVGRLAFLAFQEQGDDLGGDRAGPGVELGVGEVGDRVRDREELVLRDAPRTGPWRGRCSRRRRSRWTRRGRRSSRTGFRRAHCPTSTTLSRRCRRRRRPPPARPRRGSPCAAGTPELCLRHMRASAAPYSVLRMTRRSSAAACPS